MVIANTRDPSNKVAIKHFNVGIRRKDQNDTCIMSVHFFLLLIKSQKLSFTSFPNYRVICIDTFIK